MAEFDNMHQHMMKGFGGKFFKICNLFIFFFNFKGGSLFKNDPFANDPFFQDAGFGGDMFGHADKMMKQMRNQMADFDTGMNINPKSLGKGQFIQQTIKS